MNPNNLAKIKAANEKLLRLDPDYVAHRNANRVNHVAILQAKTAKVDPMRIQWFSDQVYDVADYSEGSLISGFENDLEALEARDTVTTEIKATTRAPTVITHKGQSLTARAWSAKTGLTPKIILRRLASGKPAEEALQSGKIKAKHFWCTSRKLKAKAEKPRPSAGRRGKTYTYANETLTAMEWADKFNLSVALLRSRLKRGWSIEAAVTIGVGAVQGRQAHGGGWVNALEESFGTSGGGSLDIAPKQAFFQGTEA